jgi:hypothetical protein
VRTGISTGAGNADRLEPFGLLASAIAGRDLAVEPGEPGTRAWTDGSAVFVDAGASPRAQVESLAVQASLVAAGSFAPEVLRKLRRRPSLARRYLAVEGHRALAAVADVLPRSLRSLLDADVAGGVDSPAASLAIARSRAPIPDPPDSFGALRTKPLLASIDRVEGGSPAQRPPADGRRERAHAELAADDGGAGAPLDAFTSPTGGGGAIGRLLARLLREVRQLSGVGPLGADAAARWSRAGRRGQGSTLVAAGTSGAVEAPAAAATGTSYPEWDAAARRYRAAWCTVHEIEPPPTGREAWIGRAGRGLRRPLARLGTGLEACHRQPQGDDVDLDAAIEARVESLAGSAAREAVYLDSVRRQRDLSVLLLLDVSGSAGEPAAAGRTVHEEQREVAAALTAALQELGDRVALYAFRSQGRSLVHVLPVKRFDAALDAAALRRLGGLEPVAYSRLGAAIRHGTTVLRERGGTSRRILVVLSDGLAYDHGYEPRYGAADARRALGEARAQGVGCLCLTVGAGTDSDALRRVFGSAAHATVPRPEQLPRVIGPLFRAALRSAEVRRRVSA